MSKLFSPITIRNLTVKNRLWVSPMCMYSCEKQDGVVGDFHLVHLGARALGGAGLVMAEAMACYTPVIATQTDGASEQIKALSNGILISQQETEQQLVVAFTHAIERMWQQNPAEYQRMQQQARTTAEQYLLGQVVNELQQLYQEILL